MTALSSRFKRPSPWLFIFSLGAFITLIGLGVWQLQRLEWKENLIAEISAAGKADPITTIPSDPEELKKLEFHPVALGGVYLQEPEFHITPRYIGSELGYHIFTPFKLEDGRIVLVNRGWVPAAKKLPENRPGSNPPKGFVTVKGLLRVQRTHSYFTPKDQPGQNIWFARDAAAMLDSAHIKDGIPASIDIVGEQDKDRLPVPSDGKIEIRNDHLQYAITWFLIAAGLLIVFLTYHHKGKNEA